MNDFTPGPWQHTPEPLTVVADMTLPGAIWSEHKRVAFLTDVLYLPSELSEVEANGRLIAAAPDLLEALRKGRAFLARWSAVHGDDEDIDEEGALANAFGEALDALRTLLGPISPPEEPHGS